MSLRRYKYLRIFCITVAVMVLINYTRAAEETDNARLEFTVQNDWGAGCTLQLSLENISSTPMNGWSVELDIKNMEGSNIQVDGQPWNCSHTNSPDGKVLLTGSQTLPPGGSHGFGFNGSPGNVVIPEQFIINGIATTPQLPHITITSTQATEGAPITSIIRLSSTFPDPVSVRVTTSDGSATAGSDYTGKSELLTFAPDEVEKEFIITTLNDTLLEGPESIVLTLSDITNAETESTTTEITLLDDEVPQSTSFRLWLESHDIPMNTDPCTDTDADGNCLLLEYAFNHSSQSADTLYPIPIREGADLFFEIPHFRNDVKYEVQYTTDLEKNDSWKTVEGNLETSENNFGIRVKAPTSDQPKTFFRVRVLLLEYVSRFLELYHEIHDPANGYFSAEGVPYHSIETLLCEAPDYGHETTSEAMSYWIWMEAMYGKFTGDWAPLQIAWDKIEEVIIPTQADQPTNSAYSPSSPAGYTDEKPLPSDYPVALDTSAAVGSDFLADELESTYGTPNMYLMHWLLDVENWYGYGRRGDGVSKPSYINTFQRGEQESVWETVPHPSWENFTVGTDSQAGGSNGFLPIFIDDPSYTKQWRYTAAPDADARAIQAMYWAKQWADAQGGSSIVDGLVTKSARMGDYLRYSFADKYFREIGAPDTAGSGKNSSHYLLSWYVSWGGSVSTTSSWAFRIGSSHCHMGYQNPFAAKVLSSEAEFIPDSPTAQTDWQESFKRQMEFYRWLQSKEGGFAGGATNSIDGQYNPIPAGVNTFYGMAYDEDPVYHDPASNSWYGFQTWSVERLAELYYEFGDTDAEEMLDKWVAWSISETQLENNDYMIPVGLEWAAQPESDFTGTGNITDNTNLSVTVTGHNQDVGIVASLARTLLYYSAGKERHTGTRHLPSYGTAKTLLDRQWTQHRTSKGLAVAERRGDYVRFFEEEVFIPSGFSGQMTNGDVIEPGVKFLDIRSKYRDDPAFPALEQAYQDYLTAKATDPNAEFESPEFLYHRFFAQIDAALANGNMHELFEAGGN